MTRLPDGPFAARWNAAGSLAELVEQLSAESSGRVPRWVLLARAVAARQTGADLKHLPDETPPARTLPRTRALALRLMADHGLAGWEFGFNSNVRRAGVCRYSAATRPGRIELSRHFVLRNPEAEVRDTLLHEVAHALVGPGHGHDAAWRARCIEVGARPERCYGGEVEMPRGRWRAACPSCRHEFDRHRRPTRLTGWFCKPCGQERGPLRWRDAG